ELSFALPPPAVRRTSGHDAAGERTARRQRGEGVSARDRGGYRDRVTRRADAELASGVAPPAVRLARRGEATRVPSTDRQRREAQRAAHGNGNRVVRDAGAPEGAELVVAPAEGVAQRIERAVLGVARADRTPDRCHAHCRRPGGTARR